MNRQFEILFENASFPVLAVYENGKIFYKNKAAKRLLPSLRRGADIVRRLHLPLLCAGLSAELIENTPYHRALVLSAEEDYVFLFLPRLQFPDGNDISAFLAKKTEGRLPSFDDLPMQEGENAASSRLVGDILRVVTDAEMKGESPFAFQTAWNKIADGISGAFRALGYRVTMEHMRDDDSSRQIPMSLCSFAYLFSRLLLVQMKHSANGIVTVDTVCDTEKSEQVIRFSSRTILSEKRLGGLDTTRKLSVLAPECAVEFAFLSDMKDITDALDMYVDAYGKLVLEYRIPYVEAPRTLVVRSIDWNASAFARILSSMVSTMTPMLKKIEE